MKIYASRKDDLIRERDEWDQRRRDAEEQWQQSHQKYLYANKTALKPIEDFLDDKLSQYPHLEFDYDVEESSWGGKYPIIRVYIKCNQGRFNDDSCPLVWSFEVKLHQNNGEVLKESSSWSGLKATTAEHIETLEETVSCLKMLNDVDWAQLLNVKMPDWDEYHEDERMTEQRPDFENQIIEAEIEEALGKNIAIHGDLKNESARGWKSGWYIFLRETPKKYMAKFIADGSVKYWLKEDPDMYPSESSLLRQVQEMGRDVNIWKRDLSDLIDYPINSKTF